jgi:hypothetical protein
MHERAIQTSSAEQFDTDPIEARVIDEALKILGPNGEKWIKGRETDKQHNHCMVGPISLARRRLKVKDDATKDLFSRCSVSKARYRSSRLSMTILCAKSCCSPNARQ